MSRIDLDQLRGWIGRSRTDEDVIAARHARLMAATVDHPAPERICDGEPLPALWHWLYFLDAAPTRELGRDGHAARGEFLPPVPLSNRMWAGGRVRFLAPVTIGATVRRTSEILRVEHKLGRAGDLVFVTVLHAIASSAGEPLVREEHDIVYKDPSPPSRAAGGASVAASEVADAQHIRRFTPNSVMLFRYSALTFNGHRIHYDADYCRDEEGYPGCVVHGPLVATLLANFAEDIGGTPIRDFNYRAMSPTFVGNIVTLRGDRHDGGLDVCATTDEGRVLMQADASTG